MPRSMVAIGICTPIRPVLETATSSGLTPSRTATSSQVRSALAMPVAPVQALALPLLIAAARRYSDSSTRLRQT